MESRRQKNFNKQKFAKFLYFSKIFDQIGNMMRIKGTMICLRNFVQIWVSFENGK